jgi:ADP-ribose pyrophosphatase YjhB (NUDIX family)
MKRDYPDRPIVGVGAAIVSEGRVLLIRRAAEPLKGEWSIPGGALELGETLHEGIRRESLEETGLQVEPQVLLGVFDRIYTDDAGRAQYHYVVVDYLCRLLHGEAHASSDVSEVTWVTEAELSSLELRESIEQVVRKALAEAQGKTD